MKIVRVTPHKTSPIRDTPHVVPPAYGCFRTPPTGATQETPTGGAATTPAARPPARRGRDATRCWRARANSTRTPRSPVAYYVPHPPPYTRAGWCFPRGRRVAEVPEAGGHQWASEFNKRHSVARSGNRRQSTLIRGEQRKRHSEALRGTQRHSEALRGTQRHSEALRGTHRHSQTLTDTHRHSQRHTQGHSVSSHGGTPWHSKAFSLPQSSSPPPPRMSMPTPGDVAAHSPAQA